LGRSIGGNYPTANPTDETTANSPNGKKNLILKQGDTKRLFQRYRLDTQVGTSSLPLHLKAAKKPYCI
jgi:hypothetical protein